MKTRVKVCGLKRPEHVRAAADAGAAYLGFVHFGKSPRHLEVDDIAALTWEVPAGIAKVVLVVNPDDATLDTVCGEAAIDMIQLHGGETPERVAEVKARYGLPVMKAIGVAEEADFESMAAYERVADQILVDAKPPAGSAIPGGNGIAFDWRLVAGRRWTIPWMLAGGLTPENVAEAVRLTGASQIDASSGMETSPGEKDEDLIRAFLGAAP